MSERQGTPPPARLTLFSYQPFVLSRHSTSAGHVELKPVAGRADFQGRG